MLNACLIKKKQVGILDERRGKENPRLLAAGKGADDAVVWRVQVDHVEHSVDTRVDVIDLFIEHLLEKFSDGKLHFRARNDLPSRRNSKTRRNVYRTRLGLPISDYKF